jgi:transposase
MEGKKIWGRKRHLLVDTQGLLLAVKVHSAGLVDCRGAPLLLQDLGGRFPRLRLLFADSAYAGTLPIWIKAHLGWQTDIVSKPQSKGGFQVQPHRWKIERTFGWLIRYRRLARDYEGLPSSSEALIQIASIRLFLTRLKLSRSISL